MEKTKIIQLLKTFNTAEFKEFGKFLKSPLHNESLKMVRLYTHLKKFYPHFNANGLRKETVFHKMYGDVKYDNKKFRERLSDMLRLAEEYLAVINLKKDPVKYKTHTLNEFSERNLAVHFDKKHREIMAILDKETFKDENSFYEDYILQSKLIEFYQNTNLLGKRKSFFDEIAEHIELFLRYFVTQMLKNYAVINNIKNVMKYPYEQKFYKQVMEYTDEYDLERYPIIKALRFIININENREDESSYFGLKELYLKHHAAMNPYDKTMISTELQIHSKLIVRKDDPGLNSERLEMMKLQLEHDTYPKDKGCMKREFFFVTVETALNNGSLEWARWFIKEYSVKIEPGLRENVQLWAAGVLYFYEKKYELALKEFSKIKIGDYVYYFWVKIPVSKTYYEMKEYDNVLMLIDSFKHYTAANTLIPEHVKDLYNTFINLLNKLTMLSLNYDDHKSSKLAEEINSSKSVSIAGKLWLLEKVSQLKKKR